MPGVSLVVRMVSKGPMIIRETLIERLLERRDFKNVCLLVATRLRSGVHTDIILLSCLTLGLLWEGILIIILVRHAHHGKRGVIHLPALWAVIWDVW
ncbi:hypothetical protein AF72_13265 [Xylella taiwanensis]|uniref:Uncharacterized protein n=1 Tax=Xylella taiwanensis TaxID=1444770 RepID=Z9JG39_9GAMM|nr:hypothetical protein AF72_13265 [Xylella taiwanensis]